MKTIEQYRDDCARMRDLLQRACFLLDELRPKAELLDEIDKLTFDIAKLGGPVYSEADRSLRRPAGYVPCECGQILGEPCDECFPAGDIVVVEHMPQHLRASHVEGRNRGTYPANGAVRLRCYIGHALVRSGAPALLHRSRARGRGIRSRLDGDPRAGGGAPWMTSTAPTWTKPERS